LPQCFANQPAHRWKLSFSFCLGEGICLLSVNQSIILPGLACLSIAQSLPSL